MNLGMKHTQRTQACHTYSSVKRIPIPFTVNSAEGRNCVMLKTTPTHPHI